MKYLNNRIFLASAFFLSVISCSPYQKMEVSKAISNVGGPQTLIYSLPKTRIDIAVAVTKTTTKAGPYAAYAEKYLSLTGAPLTDSDVYEISAVKIVPVNEPDPDHFYSINFKSYPSNLEKLFTMTQQGLMLNLENSWNALSREFPSKYQGSGIVFERSIYEPTISEKTDTLYKTILTDASFVKVPVYKKSLTIKNEADKAQDMADLILKLRKRRVKLMMGEYDYHPDGAALKVIVAELTKQEEELMANFIGKKTRETRYFYYSFAPTSSLSKEMLWFSEDKGVSETPRGGASAVSVTISMKDSVIPVGESKPAEKITNSIFFRSPVIAQVSVKTGNTILAESKVPVYQAGKIQQMPVLP